MSTLAVLLIVVALLLVAAVVTVVLAARSTYRKSRTLAQEMAALSAELDRDVLSQQRED